jgi:hypothetical protein
MVYTGLFLAVVVLTLALSVFSTGLASWLPVSPLLLVLERSALLRLGVLFFLQTALFCGMFMGLPSRGNGFQVQPRRVEDGCFSMLYLLLLFLRCVQNFR